MLIQIIRFGYKINKHKKIISLFTYFNHFKIRLQYDIYIIILFKEIICLIIRYLSTEPFKMFHRKVS